MPDPTLDLRNLRYIVLAAERGSFRRVAAELEVHQSTVSRRVQLVERRLGAAIFERHPGGVTLTAAGEIFLRDATIGAHHLRRAVQAVACLKRGRQGVLRIGLFVSLAAGFLGELVERYRERHEGVDLQFEENTAERNLSRVINGELDIAFVTGTPDPIGCETLQLWEERIFVALPSSHTLSGKTEVLWDDIRQERFIVSAGGPGPEIHDYLIKRLSALGFRPDISIHRVGRENLMNMVARGFGLTLTTASTLGTSFAGLTFLPIAGDEDIVPCSAVWSSSNSNPALHHLLAIGRDAAKRKAGARLNGAGFL
ncbi:LysR family transcriptional regulator [Agrobacterium deltaense]|uniref:LysR family transcriptional regulator n=1 Tax=Agrobacterium deltaense TaxID=1183412 RepID=UPI000F644F36|nr:LysR family transcriptional regulator [Agrobacterium deltaense]RRN74611.1 LysR family transcriptional regulator [Agrobacterium deltaense]